MPLSYAPLRDEILASVCLLSIGNARDGRGLTDIETHLGNPPLWSIEVLNSRPRSSKHRSFKCKVYFDRTGMVLS
jgi:hypothetical protein